MAKTWILQTDTKGTGATMVPLDSVTKRRPELGPLSVPSKPKPQKPEPPKPRAPLRFRVVDVMTRQTLAADAGAAETIETLRGVRSIVDVNVYVWQEQSGRWRLLTFPEQRTLFARSGH